MALGLKTGQGGGGVDPDTTTEMQIVGTLGATTTSVITYLIRYGNTSSIVDYSKSVTFYLTAYSSYSDFDLATSTGYGKEPLVYTASGTYVTTSPVEVAPFASYPEPFNECTLKTWKCTILANTMTSSSCYVRVRWTNRIEGAMFCIYK